MTHVRVNINNINKQNTYINLDTNEEICQDLMRCVKILLNPNY